jgi:hypothetical protein
LSHACAHSLSNAQGAVSIKACMYSRTLWKYIVFQPMSASSHCYCPGGHVSNSVHWVIVATHVSRASRFALGGATPATHRCWVVALVGGTPHRTHTLPGICDGAHKQHGCVRAQMYGCVFRGLLAQGTDACSCMCPVCAGAFYS